MPEIYDSRKREKREIERSAVSETGKREKQNRWETSRVLRQSKPTKNPLAHFIPLPVGVGLEVLDEDEEILLMVRRHVITNLKWVVIVVAMVVASMFLSILPFFPLMRPEFQLMTLILWYLLTTAIALEGFFSWYFDLFVITDERIIDIDFKNLIYKNITATKIENIEDVTYSVSGAIPSMLNYGNVVIQTAGAVVTVHPQETQASIEMVNTPKPAMVARLINELILEEEQERIEGRTH